MDRWSRWPGPVKKPSRSVAASKNLLSSWVYYALTLGLGVVTTPFLLHALGNEQIGAFRTLLSLVGFLPLLEFGLAGALQTRFAKAIHEDERQLGLSFRVSQTISNITWCKVLLVIVVTSPILYFLAPLSNTLRLPFAICWLLLGIGSSTTWLIPIRSWMEANQQSSIVNYLLICQYIVVTTLTVLTAWLSFGLIGQGVAYLLGAIPFIVGMIYFFRKLFPNNISIQAPESLEQEHKQIRKLQLPTFLNQLSGQIGVYSDNLIVMLMIGPSAVTPFFLTQRLPQIAMGLLQTISASSWAGLSQLFYEGRVSELRDRILELTKLVVVGSILILGPVIVLNEPFINLWVGSDQYNGPTTSILACSIAFLFSLMTVWGWLFRGIGKIQNLWKIQLLASVVNLGASILATFLFGTNGPLIGTLVSILLIQFASYLYMLVNLFTISTASLLRSLVAPIVIAIPVMFVLRFSIPSNITSWLELLLSLMFMFSCLAVIEYALAFSRKERVILNHRLLATVRAFLS